MKPPRRTVVAALVWAAASAGALPASAYVPSSLEISGRRSAIDAHDVSPPSFNVSSSPHRHRFLTKLLASSDDASVAASMFTNSNRRHSLTALLASADASFDETAFEADRLSKDAKAMDEMKDAATEQYAKLRTPWKWRIRKAVWDYLEEKDLAEFPRPVHHRIPNFIGADEAAERMATLPEFEEAQMVKVNPDTPQRRVRYLVLENGKTLLTPQPRLRTGFFSTLKHGSEAIPHDVPIEALTSSKGAAKHGTPITLYEEYTVDLVVVGSTAVCPNTGARVGKGEGFAELEWGILSQQGNLDASKVLVVTTVHDCQVFDGGIEEPWKSLMADLREEGDTGEAGSGETPFGTLTQHDVPVDIVVTPTRIIRVPNRLPKPSGVYWNLLSPQKLAQIRVLQELKNRTEAELGEMLPSGPDEVLPPTASRKGRGGRGRGGRGRGKSGRGGRGRGGRS